MNEPLLDAHEVAAWLNLTHGKVLKLRRMGALPAIDVSAGTRPTYRWRRSTIETFLRNRKT